MVTAVLGPPPPPPRFDSAARTSGLGSSTTVLVVLLQAPAASRQATVDRSARWDTGASSEKVGPNVVFPIMTRVGAVVEVGLIETIRARDGRLPWLREHMARLRASVAALSTHEPPADLPDLIRMAAGTGDRVVRVELHNGHIELTTRDVNIEQAIDVVVSDQLHHPYPHKTTLREQFGRALAGARRVGAHDALLVTAEGYVAEGTSWNLFWWEDGTLRTPALDLGVLPGIGRRRVAELVAVTEQRAPVAALQGRSLFLVNAVRGVVEIALFQGQPVPRDPRTAELSSAFWPD
jgi:branched-subunit amino acid aminotransferase/4-amino-4-deoxychorismate lyase